MPTIAMPTIMPLAPIAEAQACRAIAFQIAGHWLALPSTAILRVVHKAALTVHAGADHVGAQPLIYVGKQPLPIADLHPILAAVQGDYPPLADTGQFLLIVAVSQALVAIPSDQPPTLIELSLTATHPVPSPYYKAIRGIASHMAMVPPLGTVLLLNLCRL